MYSFSIQKSNFYMLSEFSAFTNFNLCGNCTVFVIHLPENTNRFLKNQQPRQRQPLQAVQDMCDPYLNLFRNTIPPSKALELSPLLASLVLGVPTFIFNINSGRID